MLSQLSRGGGGWIDADTVVSPASDEVARLAAGGALAVLDAVISREPSRPTSAFVLARPPGHHAMAERAMGFCLYNSVAVAARYAQRRHGVRRVLVLDWDVHHGNGTQHLFYDDPSVLFISLHQYPLWPPGWGWLDQVGSGEGRGSSVNVPLPSGEGDAGYALACERVVRPIATAFRPELVLVAAGQDGHIADPISSMALTAGGFAALARLAREIAASAGAYGPVLLLEGGYNPTTLPYLVAAILDALGDLDLGISDPYARHVPVSDEALRRLQAVEDTLRPWWTLS
jgi:acetoin utilization deacetylase AcuC-like enzyme